MFIDFSELKAVTTMADIVSMLGLKLRQSGNQWRGPCPTCKAGGDRALVITEGKGFYCFSGNTGGDQIALVAHIKDVGAKDAANAIATWKALIPRNNTVPRSQGAVPVPESARGEETKKFPPLAYLECEHPAVDAIGFDAAFAKMHGIGYAGKGILRGTVAVPFRDETGVLLGYIGITDAKLPPTFTANVVAFAKKSA
ncbi:MAG: hypothetical protein JOZ43_02250 [Acidobacteriales bacterium]|nr:hypothetical protein [Terriglobales bacterium]